MEYENVNFEEFAETDPTLLHHNVDFCSPSVWREKEWDLLCKKTPYGLFENSLDQLYIVTGNRYGKFAIILEGYSTPFSAFRLGSFPDDFGTYLGPLEIELIGLEEDEDDLGELRFRNGSVEMMCCFPDNTRVWLPLGVGPDGPTGSMIRCNRWSISSQNWDFACKHTGHFEITDGVHSEIRSFCPAQINVDVSSVDLEDIRRKGLDREGSFEWVELRSKA